MPVVTNFAYLLCSDLIDMFHSVNVAADSFHFVGSYLLYLLEELCYLVLFFIYLIVCVFLVN